MTDIRTSAQIFYDTYGFSDPVLDQPPRGRIPELMDDDLYALAYRVKERARELEDEHGLTFARRLMEAAEVCEDYIRENGEPRVTQAQRIAEMDEEMDDWEHGHGWIDPDYMEKT